MSRKTKRKPVSVTRPQRLEGAAMNYAPVNELGVVLLFPQIAKRYGIQVDSIQAAFPDCIAYRSVGGKTKRLRIEFEYRSKTFDLHGHDANECDMIVCWEHDRVRYKHWIEVLELRREYGLGFNVWIQSVQGRFAEAMAKGNSFSRWSVAPRAAEGDLVLYYRSRPNKSVADLFRITGPVLWRRSVLSAAELHKKGPGYKAKMDHFAPIRRVCRLGAPVFLEDLQRHRVLQTAGFVRGQMQGRRNASEYWPYLYDLIVRRNPSVRRRLSKYEPGRLAG